MVVIAEMISAVYVYGSAKLQYYCDCDEQKMVPFLNTINGALCIHKDS